MNFNRYNNIFLLLFFVISFSPCAAVQISLRTLRGVKITIEVTGNETIIDVRRLVAQQLKIPLNQIRIIFEGTDLSRIDGPIKDFGSSGKDVGRGVAGYIQLCQSSIVVQPDIASVKTDMLMLANRQKVFGVHVPSRESFGASLMGSFGNFEDLIKMPTDVWKIICSFIYCDSEHDYSKKGSDFLNLINTYPFDTKRLKALGAGTEDLVDFELAGPVLDPDTREVVHLDRVTTEVPTAEVPTAEVPVTEVKNNTVRNLAMGGASLLTLTIAEFSRLCRNDFATKQSVAKHGKIKTFFRYYFYALRHPVQSFKKYKLFTTLALSLPLGGVSVGAVKAMG